MSRIRRVVASFGAITLALLALPFAAHAAVDPAVVQGGVDYLATTQIGGTDPATGSGAWDGSVVGVFNTFDAVLGIAEAAQTGPTWSTTEAFDAVDDFENPDGVDPLPYMDLVGLDATTPGRAAKIITLWAAPLGLDPTAFDPDPVHGAPVDLVDVVGAPMPNGAYADDLHYSDTLYAILATSLVGGTISPTSVAYIRDGQTVDGSWAYNHDATNTADADVDTTSLSIQALIAAGVSATDAAVVKGLAYIAGQQEPNGQWFFFGTPSSETTSRALLAVAAAGIDVNSRCWRDSVLPSAVADPFVGGDAALSSFAQPDGSIADPSSFSPSYSTAQALEGLLRNWLPVALGAAQNCNVPVPPVTSTDPDVMTVATPVVVTPAFTG
ncbi:MAG TPA: prenyltransferase/squalene oxidase repeat-containing protein [Acidimicrobiia bacterium]|nr:prenyltransferase/squalene oxidase repeat-containing protein [Acidimicrobiia bacterium]